MVYTGILGGLLDLCRILRYPLSHLKLKSQMGYKEITNEVQSRRRMKVLDSNLPSICVCVRVYLFNNSIYVVRYYLQFAL